MDIIGKLNIVKIQVAQLLNVQFTLINFVHKPLLDLKTV